MASHIVMRLMSISSLKFSEGIAKCFLVAMSDLLIAACASVIEPSR